MEQRAPGHTVADGKIYRKGMLDFKADIATARGGARLRARPRGARQARAAARHVHRLRRRDPLRRAARRAGRAPRPRRRATTSRRAELLKIADVCRRVPAHAPRDFHEALQTYWFCHLAVITELNGWDAFSPGHLDQHLWPFYQAGPGRRHAHARVGARAARVLLHQVQQPHRAAEGGRHRGRERHLHRLRQHQPRRPAARRQRRLERADAPAARHHRRDAPAAAEQQHAGLAQDARRRAEARAARHPQRLRLPVALQRRRRRRGAAPPGQDARGRARGRVLGLRRGRARSARRPTSSPATST